MKPTRRKKRAVPLHTTSPSGLEIRQLRAFVALVDSKRVTAAAEALGLAQSTVSEALAALEPKCELSTCASKNSRPRLCSSSETLQRPESTEPEVRSAVLSHAPLRARGPSFFSPDASGRRSKRSQWRICVGGRSFIRAGRAGRAGIDTVR
jgi:Bacterial regulatory helix-turn-helix protein, lysR family